MGVLKLTLPDELEERFRQRAMEQFGHGRGSMSRAGEEAILAWLAETEAGTDVRPATPPIATKRGALSHVDVDSVELQESTGKRLLEEHRRDREE